MQSAGVELELLGYSFAEGAAFVRDFAKAANTGLKLPKDILKTGKELTFVLGLTAEQAGKLVQQFEKQGAGSEQVNEMFKAGAKEARAYGLPVNDVLRDLGDAPDILARFGVANRTEFAVSASKARSYGLSIKEVTAAFGKQLDTFEGSAVAGAKLNTVFGTHINSLKLMMLKDPVKRMEMLRGELLKQGKSWEKLSVFEKNVITSTLGVDEAQAQLVLSSEEARKKMEKQAAVQRQKIRDDEKWNDGMRSIKKTLISWGPLLDKLMRSVSNFIAKLFGFNSAQQPIQDFAKTAENMMNDVTGAIDKAGMKIDEYREKWYDITEHFDSKAAEELLDLTQKQNKSLADQAAIKELVKNKDVLDIAEIKARTKHLDSSVLDSARQAREQMDSTSRALNSLVNDPEFYEAQKKSEQIDDESNFGKSIVDKPKKLSISQKSKIDKEKANKIKEEKKKEEKVKNKELADTLADAINRKGSNKEMKIILTDTKGFTLAVGKGLVNQS
jgi:hypothetical protein